jgi:hypothetical protein
MDLPTLQRAALAPTRWASVVSRYSRLPQEIESSGEAQPIWEDRSFDLGLRSSTELVLVPGGRYLLAVGFDSYDDDSALNAMFYDLGTPGRRTTRTPRLVSSFEVACVGQCSSSTHTITAAISPASSSTLHAVVLAKRSRGIGSARPDVDYM